MSNGKTQTSEGCASLFKLDETRTPGVVVLDTAAVDRFVSTLAAVAGQLGAMAEAVQAQAVALHALADAIAAPIEEEPAVDNRPRYMDGTLIEDG